MSGVRRSEYHIIVPVHLPINVTVFLAFLYKHFSWFSGILCFFLKETAQIPCFCPYPASLLQTASPVCIVIILAD